MAVGPEWGRVPASEGADRPWEPLTGFGGHTPGERPTEALVDRRGL